MQPAHQTIIDAIIRKAEKVCPDSLALIGVYGSAATGDLHKKSDLDLLILINDDNGWQLGKGFILDDTGIGYDIYCTNWEGLEHEASCEHAHLTKLMDSAIVYVQDEKALQRLEMLRKQAADLLASDARYEKAQACMDNAKRAYADCFLARDLAEVRCGAGGVIYFVLDAVMLFHGCYYRRGVKRTFEELAVLNLPFDMVGMILQVIRAGDVGAIREAVTQLMRAVQEYMTIPGEKCPPDAGLSGTYEEMFSNWRNKMTEAAGKNDVFSSFMNMLSFQMMLSGIASGVQMKKIEVMGQFDAENLKNNAELFDRALEAYLEVYRAAGIQPRHYANAEQFAADYLQ